MAGHGGPSWAAEAESATARGGTAHVDDEDAVDAVNVGGLGRMSRRQLSRLEAAISGRDIAEMDLAELPDISQFSPEQLVVLESTLSEMAERPEFQVTRPQSAHSSASSEGPAFTEDTIGDDHEVSVDRMSWTQSSAGFPDVEPQSLEIVDLPHVGRMSRRRLRRLEAALIHALDSDSDTYSQALSSSRDNDMEEAPQGDDALTALLDQGLANGQGRDQKPWRIEEKAFQKLLTSHSGVVAPKDCMCSICCDMLGEGGATEPQKAGESKTEVALPCIESGCLSYFHEKCIRPWFERNPTCPLCRTRFDDLVVPAESGQGITADCPVSDALLALAIGPDGLADLQWPLLGFDSFFQDDPEYQLPGAVRDEDSSDLPAHLRNQLGNSTASSPSSQHLQRQVSTTPQAVGASRSRPGTNGLDEDEDDQSTPRDRSDSPPIQNLLLAQSRALRSTTPQDARASRSRSSGAEVHEQPLARDSSGSPPLRSLLDAQSREHRLPALRLPSPGQQHRAQRLEIDPGRSRSPVYAAAALANRSLGESALDATVTSTYSRELSQSPLYHGVPASTQSTNFELAPSRSSPQRRIREPSRMEGAHIVSTRQPGPAQGSASRVLSRRHVQDLSFNGRLPPREQLAQRRLERQRASSVPLLSATEGSGFGRGHRLGQAAFLALGFAPHW